MNGLRFAKRNILNFFRDKTAVFFSLLSALIIIGLYVLFLGNMISSQMQDFGDSARFIIDSWIMAGVIATTSVTSAMGALEAKVKDKENKILKDFNSAPITKRDIIAGYILSSFFVAVIMSFAALAFAELYILANGGKLLSFLAYIKIFGVIIISAISSCSFMFFIVSFFKTTTAYSTGCSIIGTLIGFLTGVYIPIGQLPVAVQTAIKIFPVSHSATLLRQIMMGDALNAIGQPEAVTAFNLQMGVNFQLGDLTITPLHSLLYITITAIVFFLFSVIRQSKKTDN